MSFYLTQGLHRAIRTDPDRVATVFDGRSQTYAALGERVARLAGLLVDLGIGPGDRIGWLAQNSDRILELLLGSVWAGGIGCPLNTRWAKAEVIHAIRECGVKVMIVGHEFRSFLPEIRLA